MIYVAILLILVSLVMEWWAFTRKPGDCNVVIGGPAGVHLVFVIAMLGGVILIAGLTILNGYVSKL